MPVYSPVVTEIDAKIYHINEFGLASAYLVVGSERALLIDTGAGFCDLTALVKRLTPLPYEVVITHGHAGHAGGMGQFQEVYVHPEDEKKALEVDENARALFLSRPRACDQHNVYGYTIADMRSWNTVPQVHHLFDGLVFDLGGRSVRTLSTPGHTTGSCSFLDDKGRILFTGDACETLQLVTDCSVSAMVRGLFSMRRHAGAFDRIYGGHLNFASAAVTRSTKPKTMYDLIAACRCILEKNAQPSDYVSLDGKTFMVVTLGTARIVYDPEFLWEPGENHAPIPIGM